MEHIKTECKEFKPAVLPLMAAYDHPYFLGEKGGFDLVITFYLETDVSKERFYMEEQGMHHSQFKKVKENEFFRVEILATKDGEECGAEYMGCCSEKRLMDFLKNDGNGFLPQLIDGAIEDAHKAAKLAA